MVVDLEPRLELLRQHLGKGRIAVQPRDLVFILERHQFEQGLGRNLCQRVGMGSVQVGAELRKPVAVALRVAVVLIGPQPVGPIRDQRSAVQVWLFARRQGQRVRRFGHHAAQIKGAMILVDSHAVQHDRLPQRAVGHRHQPFLPREAQHDHIGENRIAQKPFCHRIGIETGKVFIPHGITDHTLALVSVQLRVAVQHQIARGHFRKVQHHLGRGPVVDRRLRGRGNDDIAANHRIRRPVINAHLMDRIRARPDPDKAKHRAELLREAGEIQHAGPLALQMRGHGDQRADRDHAGAAHACDQQVKGRIKAGQFGTRDTRQQRVHVDLCLGFLAPHRPFKGDEAGAEPVQTREILVAARKVDLALAAQIRL